MNNHHLPNKKLGQHWLYDESSLQAVADGAKISRGDTVVEIGPGLGTLTQLLLEREANVLAVEYDTELARQLPDNVMGETLQVVNQDVMQFNFETIPEGYKVIGNIPYYLTSRLIRNLLELTNQPQIISLLVQKEVAQRVTAQPGEMSVLSVAAQLFAECSLGPEVPASLFTPPPKVDSQVLVMKPRKLPGGLNTKLFFRVVKAGFGERRKKLVNSLAGGLAIDKDQIETYITTHNLPSMVRAQELSLEQWLELAQWYGSIQK